jgi:outer membrane protein TolC
MTLLRESRLGLLLVGLLAGCARFDSRPLVASHTAAEFDSRSLDDRELKAFLEKNLKRELVEWPVKSWDFEELTLVAFYYHPSLDVARAQWGVAKAGIQTAGGRPNPTVGVTPEYAFNPDKGVSPWLATLNVDIPIETAGKRGYRIARAEHLSESARLNLAASAWQVRGNVRKSLLDFTAASRRAALLQEQLEAQQQLVQLLEQRLQAGAVAAPEVIPARAALLKTTVDLSEAKRLSAEARARFAEALGLPLKAIEGAAFAFDLNPSAEAARALTSGELRQQALQSRPDILGALAEYAASQSALQLEIAKQYPDVHLGTGYQFDQGEHKWSLGLTAEIPVLNRNQGPIAEALAKRAEAATRFLALQAKVIAEIDRAVANQSAAREQFRSSETLVETQRKAFDALQAAFKAGGADAVAVNGAQIELSAGALAMLDAQIKTRQALGHLEEALQIPFDALNSVERGRDAQARKEKQP